MVVCTDWGAHRGDACIPRTLEVPEVTEPVRLERRLKPLLESSSTLELANFSLLLPFPAVACAHSMYVCVCSRLQAHTGQSVLV